MKVMLNKFKVINFDIHKYIVVKIYKTSITIEIFIKIEKQLFDFLLQFSNILRIL